MKIKGGKKKWQTQMSQQETQGLYTPTKNPIPTHEMKTKYLKCDILTSKHKKLYTLATECTSAAYIWRK